jgi:hypothetical protein
MPQALIHAHLAHSGHLPQHKAIELSTHGILFLGTQHRGSNSASLATLLLNIQSIFRPTNDILVKHIRRDSEGLHQQLSQYLPISANFVTIFFYESYGTPLIGGMEQLICLSVSNTDMAAHFCAVDCSEIISCCSERIECRADSNP